ncbi:hypothetical protein Tco_0671182 [Tanacetum coccineum]
MAVVTATHRGGEDGGSGVMGVRGCIVMFCGGMTAVDGGMKLSGDVDVAMLWWCGMVMMMIGGGRLWLKSIDSGLARFNTIITSLKALDEGTLKSSLEERVNLLGNQEKKGKNDRKSFRCGDSNHLIGYYPKPSRNKDQKVFIGGSWSDSENDVEDKTNDETCLMAQSSNEVLKKMAEHVFSPPMSSRSDFVITKKKLIHNRIEESKNSSLKPSLKSGLGYVKTESRSKTPPPRRNIASQPQTVYTPQSRRNFPREN